MVPLPYKDTEHVTVFTVQ